MRDAFLGAEQPMQFLEPIDRHGGAPLLCIAKNPAASRRTSSQFPIALDAGGKPSSILAPYRLVTTRRSSNTTTPTSDLVRIKRPNPCFNLSAASGTR